MPADDAHRNKVKPLSPPLSQVAGAPLEVWGGIECSVVRVGDTWRDQVHETGHHHRAALDLDLLAALGLRTLRYPVLWERLASEDAAGWEWQDRQIEALRRRNIEVIAGLIHHGSGPAGTSLLDPLFAEKLAAYAGQVAGRYPSIGSWVVVNEPLTTARFSCLYGHWYPHLTDEAAFLRATANQARAALLAMRAIRAQAPGARFVHTEDVGRVFATPAVAAQAAYENERRWLSLDLLCGRLGRDHPWRRRLEACGVPAAHLDELATGEAAPDLIGVNHYVTSDRFLDHRVQLYPPAMRGGNGRQVYADTEAARVDLGGGLTGWEARLREVWARYQRPIAITEAHLGCDDTAEQMLWLMEAWDAAQVLRAEGADVRAVTAWALFGLMDWNTMLCERRGHYEPGAFNARMAPPAAGPLAAMVAGLAREARFSHPVLDGLGWWRRHDRVHEALRRVG